MFSSRLARAFALALALTPLSPGGIHAFAQNAPPDPALEMANTYNAAMAAFKAGNWAAAIEGFEKVIAMVTEPKEQAKIGAIHYSLGAALFNAKEYGRAIAALKTFMQKYPEDPRVGEARVSVARATFLTKDYANAATLFAALENIPRLREQALEAQAACYEELNQPEKQIPVLEKLIAPEIKTSAQANGATHLAQLYLDKKDAEKALALVNQLHAHIDLVDNVVVLNSLTVKLGDQFADDKAYRQALAAYRVVRTPAAVIDFQKRRITAMDQRMQANLAAARGNAQSYLEANGVNNGIKATQENAQQLLEQFQALPDYMPGVIFRMGRVWFEQDRKWEAIVVFDRLRHDYPKAKEAESALYSTIVCYADLQRVATVQQMCKRYLEDFPEGPNANTVGYLLGAVSLQANDPKQAASYFGTVLKQQPNSEFREQMRLGIGNAHFLQGEYDEAQKAYESYLADFPSGQFVEEATYRLALTTIFKGDFEQAKTEFTAYRQKYPKGEFLPDAGYRVMVCAYAAEKYDEVIAEAKAWLTKFPKDRMSGEVYSILGDSLAAQDKGKEAAEAYVKGEQTATTDEVTSYALFEAGKTLQKLGDWPRVSQVFEDFVKARPENSAVVAAMLWISKAKAHEGKTEEAKAFLVQQLATYLNKPKREAVEDLLQQLAQLCLKRPRPSPSDAAATSLASSTASSPAAATPAVAPGSTSGPPAVAAAIATPPPVPPWDAVAELNKQLAPLQKDANATGQARLIYARSLLAGLRRQPAEADKMIGEIASQYKIADLSPVLLAKIGDWQMQHGKRDEAAKTFESLKIDYPKSDYVDYAYVGLGELAMDAKQYSEALELYSFATDQIAASRLREATMGRGRALLELGRYAEAKKMFEQVAGTREWRGEATAEAVYYLGQVEARQKRLPEAIAAYQRVFVAYQKYIPWVARAYLASAQAFEDMGKRPEAIAHLREMLRNEKLKNLPEAQIAQARLTAWGASAAAL